MSESRPHTYTIRDLLVLTAVVAAGMAMVAMSIHRTQDGAMSGRNPQCKNNLRNLARAVCSFEIRKNGFPGYQESLAGRVVPWPVVSFPEVDRLDLYQDWIDPVANSPPKPFMALYVCPQDPPRQISGPHNSYVANAGLADLDENSFANGIFIDLARENRRLAAGDVVDGTSYTLLLSENVQATTWDVPGKRDTVFVWHSTTSPAPAMRINGGSLTAPLTAETARPSSRHHGGANFAFCDGHVRFIREEIDYRVYIELMTPDGAESDIPAVWRGYGLREADYD